jgi:hypothetical protein
MDLEYRKKWDSYVNGKNVISFHKGIKRKWQQNILIVCIKPIN